MGNGAMAKVEQARNSDSFLWILVALRVLIGWHFLYEGVVKLLEPNWTSGAYLAESRWIFAPIFHWIAQTPAALTVYHRNSLSGDLRFGDVVRAFLPDPGT